MLKRFLPQIIKSKWILPVFFGMVFFAMNLNYSNEFYEGRESGYKEVIWSDVQGYYEYFRVWFLDFDMKKMVYAETIENGNHLNQYTSGVSLMNLPFLLPVYSYYQAIGETNDGLTSPYGIALLISDIVFAFFGLLLVFKYLRRRYNRIASFITVVLIYFATNLIFYVTASPGMAHVKSFFLFACVLYITPSLIAKMNRKNVAFFAFSYALAVLVRPTNALILLFPLLYGVKNMQSFIGRVIYFLKGWKWLILMVVIALIVLAPQMYYWHEVTGKWLVYSYQGETFSNWMNPQVSLVLFGSQGGWLIYTPIVIVMLVGLFFLLKKRIEGAFPILIILILITIVNASWWTPTFACSYGHRAFIGYYAFLALPLAFIVSWLVHTKKIFPKALLGLFLVYFMHWNLQSMYWYEPWRWTDPNWKWQTWIDIFLKRSVNPADWR